MIEIQKVEIDWLQPHPSQKQFFPELNEEKIHELAEDMLRRGQQEPVHCCSDGTLFRGHRRTAAAKLLGWQEIDAVIHQEYLNAADPRVVDDLLKDNLIRRQLSELDLARCYRELARTCADSIKGVDRRDYLSQKLNLRKSGRTLERLTKLLNLPVDIQQLITEGVLTKSQGALILRQPDELKNKIYSKLRSGHQARDVMGEIHSSNRMGQSVEENAAKVIRLLSRSLPVLEKNLRKLQRLQVSSLDIVYVLDRSIAFFSKLRDRKLKARESAVSEMKKTLAGQIDQR
jgi:ParB/RepB/Spo0J family partition protein